jgi:uncharacterized protein (DUF1778 family)
MSKSTAALEKPTARISASVPDHVRARIEEAAAWKGVTIGAFIADAAAKEAEQVIERQRLIQLTSEDAALIADLLENPPAPSAELLKAAEMHKKVLGG